MTRIKSAVLFCFLLGFEVSTSQINPGFNILLNLDYLSAEKTIELYEGRSGLPQTIADLRGSQIAMATTGLLASRSLSAADLERSLEAMKFGQTVEDDVFRMTEAREHAAAINELLAEIKRRNFGRRVVATVEQLFPKDARVSTSIPLYFVAFGHQNIDAFVRRVVWHGNTPQFVGEGEGELTIVVNLAKSISYGGTVEERFIGTLGVVAHEVFHAAFGAYKDASPAWREYYAQPLTPLDHLLDLTQNEGIAHYLTFQQRTGGNVPPEWDRRARVSIAEFNKNSAELLSDRVSPSRANELIRRSNTSNYWESYGAITGLFIARQIDATLGREALVHTVVSGPSDFFKKYNELVKRDSNLPKLSDEIVQLVNKQ